MNSIELIAEAARVRARVRVYVYVRAVSNSADLSLIVELIRLSWRAC